MAHGRTHPGSPTTDDTHDSGTGPMDNDQCRTRELSKHPVYVGLHPIENSEARRADGTRAGPHSWYWHQCRKDCEILGTYGSTQCVRAILEMVTLSRDLGRIDTGTSHRSRVRGASQSQTDRAR